MSLQTFLIVLNALVCVGLLLALLAFYKLVIKPHQQQKKTRQRLPAKAAIDKVFKNCHHNFTSN